jgi:8-hydroxy-5-deazaflavin:NADPH oxidoreductase
MSEAATAIIGVGNIGRAVSRHLVAGGEPVLVAPRTASEAEALAEELGPPATAASVEDAIAAAPAVVLALWFGQMQEVLTRQSSLLEGKVVIDPSNPLGFDADGQITRTLPADQSQASIEAPGGDLHQFALNDGQVIDLDQARAAMAGAAQPA